MFDRRIFVLDFIVGNPVLQKIATSLSIFIIVQLEDRNMSYCSVVYCLLIIIIVINFCYLYI